MSQESIKPASPEVFEQFRFMYGVLRRGDWDTYLAVLHDDVEVHQSADILGTRGTFRGKQGALQAMAESRSRSAISTGTRSASTIWGAGGT